MYQVLSGGGWVIPFIVLCSIIALAICIERQFALNRRKIAPPHPLATVWQQLRGGDIDAQRLRGRRLESPLSAVLAATLMRAMVDRLQSSIDRPVMLSADALTHHQNVVTAMDAASRLGLGLLTMDTESSSDD